MGLKQVIDDTKLLYDLACSYLRFKGYLKIKSHNFWFYQTKEGVRFKLRRYVWDSAVIAETWHLHEYSQALSESQKIKTVIDIGAHLGSLAIYMAWRYPQAKVIAFEPAPQNFQLLKENIALNRLGNQIKPYQMAVAAKANHHAWLKLHPDNYGMHELRDELRPQDSRSKMVAVKTITLGMIFKRWQIESCDLLKLDCEGAEYAILFSADKKLLQKIKLICLEYHGSLDEVAKLEKYLKACGFKTSRPHKGLLAKIPLLVAVLKKNIRRN